MNLNSSPIVISFAQFGLKLVTIGTWRLGKVMYLYIFHSPNRSVNAGKKKKKMAHPPTYGGCIYSSTYIYVLHWIITLKVTLICVSILLHTLVK